MTDNLSNKTQQTVFGAEFPPELKTDRRREPEVENQIAEVLRLSESEFERRLAIQNFKSPEYLKGETLVCLLNLARSENLSSVADSISDKLARTCENIVRKLLKGKGFNENFVEETVEETVYNMFVQVLGREQNSYDFWERNFFVALQRLTTNYLRSHGAKARLTDTFSALSNAENENDFDYENTLQTSETLTIEQKLEIKEVLGKMTAENRNIFLFHRVNGWTQEQIAVVFGITSRTVRSRLKAIDEYLENFRIVAKDEK